jgi:uncharacterized protein
MFDFSAAPAAAQEENAGRAAIWYLWSKGVVMEFLILGIGFLLVLIIVANLAAVAGAERINWLFHRFLFVANVPTAVIGAGLLLAPLELLDTVAAETALDGAALRHMGWAFLFMGLWGAGVSRLPARLLLARWMPLDPGSPVHTLALVLSGYLVGNTLLTLGQEGLEGLAETAGPASLAMVVFSQLFFVLVALLGVGYKIRRHDLGQLLRRLGLVRPNPAQLVAGVGWIAILLVLQTLAGLVMVLIDPEQAELLQEVNTRLLQEMDSIDRWFVLAVATGVGEEILFRGAMQPVLGIGFTALIFAFAHIQYGFTAITFFVVVMGVIFGIIRRRYNTTVAVFVHFGYNFSLGLLTLLLPYLEEMAG